jgi:diacylglycerol kinase (ATP)
MRAIAILGPDVQEKQWWRFRLPGVDLTLNSTSARAEAVLIFGGDGTVHRHLAFLAEARMPVLVVPSGSGNDFAKALGIRDATAALRLWEKFVSGASGDVAQGVAARVLDLGRITPLEQPNAHGALFCCVGGAGLDSDANRRANAMPRWLRGHGGYLLAATGAILGHAPAKMRLRAEAADGKVVLEADEPAEMAAFANAPAYGGGLRIAPGATLDDGKLEVVFVRRASRLRLLLVAPRVLSGSHVTLPEVRCVRATSLTLHSDPPCDVYADGEFICRTPVRVEVAPQTMQCLVNP